MQAAMALGSLHASQLNIQLQTIYSNVEIVTHSFSACNGCQNGCNCRGQASWTPFSRVICLVPPHCMLHTNRPLLQGRKVLQLNRLLSLKSMQNGIGQFSDHAQITHIFGTWQKRRRTSAGNECLIPDVSGHNSFAALSPIKHILGHKSVA